jgi:hypothetical protein
MTLVWYNSGEKEISARNPSVRSKNSVYFFNFLLKSKKFKKLHVQAPSPLSKVRQEVVGLSTTW